MGHLESLQPYIKAKHTLTNQITANGQPSFTLALPEFAFPLGIAVRGEALFLSLNVLQKSS